MGDQASESALIWLENMECFFFFCNYSSLCAVYHVSGGSSGEEITNLLGRLFCVFINSQQRCTFLYPMMKGAGTILWHALKLALLWTCSMLRV